MIKLWILAAKFTSTKITISSLFQSTKDNDSNSNSAGYSSSNTKGPLEKYVSGYYLWL
jgi:hypothetical protein